MHTLWNVVQLAYSRWSARQAPRLAAALAFYAILSLAPLLVLVVAIAAFAFGRESAQGYILWQFQNVIGTQAADAVKAVLEQSAHQASGGVAAVMGMAALLFGASGVFGELESALNEIWGVESQGTFGIWNTIRSRFFSFGMVFAVGFLLLLSLVVNAALAALGKFASHVLPVPESILSVVDLMISVVGVTILFTLMLRYVPAHRLPWRGLWTGAAGTAVLFTIGKFFIGLYLGKAAVGSAYGAAGSLIVILVWIYYSANIFLFGAEFTYLWACPKQKQVAVRQHG